MMRVRSQRFQATLVRSDVFALFGGGGDTIMSPNAIGFPPFPSPGVKKQCPVTRAGGVHGNGAF